MKNRGGILVGLALLPFACAACGGAGSLSNDRLARQVSARFGPDRRGSTLVACYTPADGATFNRVCYDPIATSAKLYLRVTGSSWCVVWPRGKPGPLCRR